MNICYAKKLLEGHCPCERHRNVRRGEVLPYNMKSRIKSPYYNEEKLGILNL
jgi:hypothetical protein